MSDPQAIPTPAGPPAGAFPATPSTGVVGTTVKATLTVIGTLFALLFVLLLLGGVVTGLNNIGGSPSSNAECREGLTPAQARIRCD